MAWGLEELEPGTTKIEGAAIGCRQVTHGRGIFLINRGLVRHLPVRIGHHHHRAKLLLHTLGAADVIVVGVGHNDIAQIMGIQTQFLHTVDYQLGQFTVEGIEENQTLVGFQHPGGNPPGADIIEVVEHLEGRDPLHRRIIPR